MFKKFAWPLASLVLTGAIWFLTPASNPAWIKTASLQGFSDLPASPSSSSPNFLPDPETFYFGLTEKLYTVTLFGAMGIYGKGIWVITPATNPSWIKDVILGFGLFLLMAFFLYFAFQRWTRSQTIASILSGQGRLAWPLCLVLLSLMILTVITFFYPLHSPSWHDTDFSAAMILAFDFVFSFTLKREVDKMANIITKLKAPGRKWKSASRNWPNWLASVEPSSIWKITATILWNGLWKIAEIFDCHVEELFNSIRR